MVQAALVDVVEHLAKVLVVGTDAQLRETLCTSLELDGYEVRVASDVQTAVAQLRGGRCDIVVTTLQTTDRVGMALRAEIKRLQPEALTLVVDGVSSETPNTAADLGPVELDSSEQGQRRRSLKPSQLDAIVRLVTQSLERQKARSAQHGLEQARLRTSFTRVINSIWLAYQPIVHASDGRVFGYEALLRCGAAKAPRPSSVLKTAERLDLLRPLGRSIRQLAARQSSLQSPDTSLFVNLHPSDLRDPLLFSEASALSRIAPRVVLELTERSGLQEMADVAARIQRLRQLGYRIALDDLGAGYSGLNVIAKIEPEVVKLDMSLVQGIHSSPTQHKVVRSMIGLSKDIGALVIAEGVEDEADRQTLTKLGCDLLQGYLFGEPHRLGPEVSPSRNRNVHSA